MLEHSASKRGMQSPITSRTGAWSRTYPHRASVVVVAAGQTCAMPPTLIRQATAAITTVSTVSKTSSSDQLDIDIQKASSAVQPRPTGWRYRLGVLLDEPRSSTAASGVFTLVICAIFVSVFVFYLQTVVDITPSDGNHLLQRGDPLAVMEATCVFIFTLEVTLRVVVGTLDVWRLLLLDAYFWVDLLSIIPFYAELIITSQPHDCTGGLAGMSNITVTTGFVPPLG